MDKIKNLLHVGQNKDAQAVQGSSEQPVQGSGEQAIQSEQNAGGMLKTDSDAAKNKSSILSQIINPGGEKYDEVRHGTTAHADSPINVVSTGTQLPGSASAPLTESRPLAEDNQGVTRQPLNPGSEGIPGTTRPHLRPNQDNASTMSIKSGVVGPYSNEADNLVTGSEYGRSGTTVADTSGLGNASSSGVVGQSALGETSQGTASTSAYKEPLARDAVVGGAAATGIGAAGYEAGNYSTDPSKTSATEPTRTVVDSSSQATSTLTSRPRADETVGASGQSTSTSAAASELPSGPAGSTYTERSFPLGGGATSTSTSQPSAESGLTGLQDSSNAPSNIRETAYPETDPNVPGQSTEGISSSQPSHLGRDVGIAGGVGAGVLGAGAVAEHERERQPRDDLSAATSTTRTNPVEGSAPFHHDGETPVEGYVHHTQGPHATDAANRLDPHVPGEFGDESGLDRHAPSNLGQDAAIGSAAGVGATGLGAAGHETRRATDLPSTTSATEPTQTSTSSSSHPITTTTNDRFSEPSVASQGGNLTQPEHHYGRDVAIGGGIGAAGIGAYELGKGRAGDEPTSSLSGAQGSVGTYAPGVASQQPTSQELPSSTLAGRSADSFDQAGSTGSSAPSQVPHPTESNYGRDAGIAGGAGVVGAGGYEATKAYDNNLSDTANPNTTSSAPTTTRAHQSDLLNKADPSVQSDGTKTLGTNEPHYGRDAALGGVGGAGGIGAYDAIVAQQGDPATVAAQRAAGTDDSHHHEHNKLHKRGDPRGTDQEGDVAEKKPSLISRILHPHHKDKHPEDTTGVAGAAGSSSGVGGLDQNAGTAGERVAEPQSGLPTTTGQSATDAGLPAGEQGSARTHATSKNAY